MKRTKTTIATAVAGLALVAAGVPAALAVTGPSTGPVLAAKAAPSPSPMDNNACGYPSNRTPTLTLSGTPLSLPRGGGSVTFSGTLTSNKCKISNSVVGLYSKTGNANPVKVAEALTNVDGAYRFAPTTVSSTRTFATYYVPPQNSIWDGTVSNTVTVTVK